MTSAAARTRSADRLYAMAKASAADSLGGPRAYAIAGPAVRRLAVAAACFDVVTLQDDTIAPQTVRDLADELRERLADDAGRDWL